MFGNRFVKSLSNSGPNLPQVPNLREVKVGVRALLLTLALTLFFAISPAYAQEPTRNDLIIPPWRRPWFWALVGGVVAVLGTSTAV